MISLLKPEGYFANRQQHYCQTQSERRGRGYYLASDRGATVRVFRLFVTLCLAFGPQTAAIFAVQESPDRNHKVLILSTSVKRR